MRGIRKPVEFSTREDENTVAMFHEDLFVIKNFRESTSLGGEEMIPLVCLIRAFTGPIVERTASCRTLAGLSCNREISIPFAQVSAVARGFLRPSRRRDAYHRRGNESNTFDHRNFDSLAIFYSMVVSLAISEQATFRGVEARLKILKSNWKKVGR